MHDLDLSQHHILLMVIASAVSYGVTQIVKPFIWKSCSEDKAKGLIRLFAIIAGGVVGYTLSYKIVDLWFGAAAGSLNAYLIAVLKKKIADKTGYVEPQSPESEAVPASEGAPASESEES